MVVLTRMRTLKEDSTVNNPLNYYGYIFFDPELRRGLARNAARIRAPVPSAGATSKTAKWFKRGLKTIATRFRADHALLRRHTIGEARSDPLTS
jgi:hypothetical protein